MQRLFVNFRGDDGDIAARLVYETLADRFGESEVFLSSESIAYSRNFEDELLDHAAGCAVLIAIIGRHWMTTEGPDRRPKLQDPNDWVRREIAAALANGRAVLPVLVGRTSWLAKNALPADIAEIAHFQPHYLTRRDARPQLRKLERTIMTLVPDLPDLKPETQKVPGVRSRLKARLVGASAVVSAVDATVAAGAVLPDIDAEMDVDTIEGAVDTVRINRA